MTRNIENLIRAAQAQQADRALPAERIRAALPRRAARAARQRRHGFAAAAAAVAAAVTVPALALRGPGDRPALPATPPAAAPSSARPSTVPFATFPLAYRPAWTPPGFAERIRSAGGGGADATFGSTLVTRTWKKQVGPGDPWGGTELTLQVSTAVPDPAKAMADGGKEVDINGATGHYSAARGDHKSYVTWTPAAHMVLSLNASHLDITQADLLRMARSVRPDPATASAPVRLPWLPAGWTTVGVTVSGPSAARWRGDLAVTTVAQDVPGKDGKNTGHAVEKNLSVVVGSTTDAPTGGAALTVGGRPARHPVRTDEAGQSLVYLVVDLGHGREMTLIASGGDLTLADLTQIAERAVITPADLDWLGS